MNEGTPCRIQRLCRRGNQGKRYKSFIKQQVKWKKVNGYRVKNRPL